MFFRIDLDHDHYGLEKLKKRVIEYLAVRKLKNSLKGKIHVMKIDSELFLYYSKQLHECKFDIHFQIRLMIQVD